MFACVGSAACSDEPKAAPAPAASDGKPASLEVRQAACQKLRTAFDKEECASTYAEVEACTTAFAQYVGVYVTTLADCHASKGCQSACRETALAAADPNFRTAPDVVRCREKVDSCPPADLGDGVDCEIFVATAKEQRELHVECLGGTCRSLPSCTTAM